MVSEGRPETIVEGAVGWGDGLVLAGVFSFVLYGLGAAEFPELTTEEWFGFYAPAKTPASVVAAANAAINMAIKEKSVIDSLAVVGLIAKGSTAAEMAASQQAEADRWGPLVKKIGFTAES